MNKLCVTKRGIQFFNQETSDIDESLIKNQQNQTKRTPSLPQLLSKANILQKQEINNRLSRLTLKVREIQKKGLKKIIIEKEDEKLHSILHEQFSNRKDYLRSLVPIIVKKTRDKCHFGNLQSRVERGRAYLDRLEHNFDNKFIFKPPVKLFED